MAIPEPVGTPVVGEPRNPAARRRTRHAVIPDTSAAYEVEVFDARAAVNRREEIVTATNSTLRFLRFARIALDTGAAGYAPVRLALGVDEEAIFYVWRGHARVAAGGEVHELARGDVIYVGLGEPVEVETDDACDVAEYRAGDCGTRYPVQIVRHADIEGTPLAAELGGRRAMSRRTVFKLVDGSNVRACRLLFGDTYLHQRGGVGSYPPHFHGPAGAHGLGPDAKEEIYHYRCASDLSGDLPYVLQNVARPEDAVGAYVHIFDEEAVNVTPGYHDSLAPPAVGYMFTWCLGAFTEDVRDWARVLTKSGFEGEW